MAEAQSSVMVNGSNGLSKSEAVSSTSIEIQNWVPITGDEKETQNLSSFLLNVVSSTDGAPLPLENFSKTVLKNLDAKLAKTQILCVSVNRESAIHIQKEIAALVNSKDVHCYTCIGGTKLREDKLMDGQHIVIGTPGRVSNVIKRKLLCPDAVKLLVLHDVRAILNREFKEQIDEVYKQLPKSTPVCLISAAVPLPAAPKGNAKPAAKSGKPRTPRRVSEVKTSYKAAISHALHPETTLTDDEIILIKSALINELDKKLVVEGVIPQFVTSTPRFGFLSITCYNNETLEWIKTLELSPWKGAELKVTDEGQIPKMRACWTSIFLDGDMSEEKFLLRVQKQNPTLKTQLWRVLHMEKTKDDRFLIEFLVDEDSVADLNKAKNMMFLNLNRIKIHFGQRHNKVIE